MRIVRGRRGHADPAFRNGEPHDPISSDHRDRCRHRRRRRRRVHRLRPGLARRQRSGPDAPDRVDRRAGCERAGGCLRCAGRQHGHLGCLRGRRRGHLERRGRQRRRLPRPRAARQPAGRERRGRSHGQGHRLDHHRYLRHGDDPDRRVAQRRHDQPGLGQDDARQPPSPRGPRDRRLPDRHIQADRPGRGPRGRPDRHSVGRHPDGRPDGPRRHQVGPDPGQGAAGQRHDPGRGLARLPALGLRDRRAEHRWARSSRSPTTARSSSWSTSRRAEAHRQANRPR